MEDDVRIEFLMHWELNKSLLVGKGLLWQLVEYLEEEKKVQE